MPLNYPAYKILFVPIHFYKEYQCRGKLALCPRKDLKTLPSPIHSTKATRKRIWETQKSMQIIFKDAKDSSICRLITRCKIKERVRERESNSLHRRGEKVVSRSLLI